MNEKELLLQNAAKNMERPDFNYLKERIGDLKPLPKKNKHVFLRVAMAAATMFAVFIAGTIVVRQSDRNQADPYRQVYDALKNMGQDTYGAATIDGERGLLMEDSADINTADSAEKSVSDEAGGAGSYGETNVQVEGVDEADIVKNDGRYLYALSSVYESGESYQLISVVKLSDLTLVSQLKLQERQDGTVSEMYISGDRLVTVGWPPYDSGSSSRPASGFIMDDESTVVVIYDISDRSNLRQVRKFTQEGGYNSSRLVGENLYLITTQYQYVMEELRLEDIEDYLPHTVDSAASGQPKTMPADCIDIAREPENVFTVVSGISITDDTREASSHTVLGSGSSVVYATDSELYVTAYKGEDTEILKYILQGGTVNPGGRAVVPGSVNNQFALDAKDGYLRVATTSGTWSGKSKNNLYILDSSMKQAGKVTGLAEGETIQSVRYVGNMAYVVTFRQTDPLFAIDLSDPRNPAVLGQLKIPGFSSYLHPIDENTLIGIGYDADEETGMTNGLKFSLFDVSDPTDPKETFKLVFSGDCYSDATGNHKAVTWIQEKGILAVPISVYGEVTVNGRTIDQSQDGGALILKVSSAGGFELQGIITDAKSPNSQDVWTNESYDRMIQRITYADDTLYTVSNKSVISSDMQTLEHIRQLELFDMEYEEEPIDIEPSEIDPYDMELYEE